MLRRLDQGQSKTADAMIPAGQNGERRGATLTHYINRLGTLVDRRLGQLALDAARREAEHAADEARAASRAKSEFLANVSHELHTPLSSIIGFAEMMHSQVLGPLPEHYRDYAGNILDSGRHLLALVSDILDMSQLESGKYPMSEEAVPLGPLVESLLAEFGGRAAQAGLLLRSRLVDPDARIAGDARAIRRMLLLLVDNAVKFTKPGGSIFLVVAPAPEGALQIRLVDTGVGIREADLARILRPFERGGDAATARAGGAGLGLALAGAIASKHGIRVHIQSKLGVGTAITLDVPAARVLAAPAARPVPAPAPAPPAAAA
jgi:signal transduction histidine kinase